jgi:hypothetical protein
MRVTMNMKRATEGTMRSAGVTSERRAKEAPRYISPDYGERERDRERETERQRQRDRERQRVKRRRKETKTYEARWDEVEEAAGEAGVEGQDHEWGRDEGTGSGDNGPTSSAKAETIIALAR